MITVKVSFEPHELDSLTSQAQSLKIHRSTLIRQRAITLPPTTPTINKLSYNQAIENAARTVSGIPRVQLEALVASVINTIHDA